MHTVGPRLRWEKSKTWKIRNKHVGPINGEKTEICGKWEMHTVGPGIRRETLKIMENEKCPL